MTEYYVIVWLCKLPSKLFLLSSSPSREAQQRNLNILKSTGEKKKEAVKQKNKDSWCIAQFALVFL